MSAPLLMLLASLLFAGMGVCIKLASEMYTVGEIVLYRGLIGALAIAAVVRWRGGSLRTAVPAAHFWRSVTGVGALCLWTYSIGGLPLATAMTLNYMSSVWMAMFLIGGAVLMGSARIDPRLLTTVLAGFAGVALVLQPTMQAQQLWHGLAGLMSGVLAALAYLQLTTLARSGEPEDRIVFYFSLAGVLAGAVLAVASGGLRPHTAWGALLLLATGVLAVVAQLMMTRAYSIGRTLSNASLQYLGIFFGWAFGVLVFDEAINATAVAGIVLIVGAGLAATLLRERSTRPDNPSTEA